jgi:hypothetical protein
MRTQRIVFEEVTRWAQKSVKCADCGKRLTRSKTFLQTLNPFNVHELTRLPKDREQIYRELCEEADTWRRQPERCNDCQLG